MQREVVILIMSRSVTCLGDYTKDLGQREHSSETAVTSGIAKRGNTDLSAPMMHGETSLPKCWHDSRFGQDHCETGKIHHRQSERVIPV